MKRVDVRCRNIDAFVIDLRGRPTKTTAYEGELASLRLAMRLENAMVEVRS